MILPLVSLGPSKVLLPASLTVTPGGSGLPWMPPEMLEHDGQVDPLLVTGVSRHGHVERGGFSRRQHDLALGRPRP